MEAQARRRAAAKVLFSIQTGWRNTVMPFERIEFQLGDETLLIEYRVRRDGRFKVKTGGSEMLVTLYESGDGRVDLDIDGHRMTFSVDQQGDIWLVHGPRGDVEMTELPRYPLIDSIDASGGLMAPMPGVVVSTEVKSGDVVEKGQLMLILEAMKMEHRITAPRDGIIDEIRVATGDQVANGELLVQMVVETKLAQEKG